MTRPPLRLRTRPLARALVVAAAVAALTGCGQNEEAFDDYNPQPGRNGDGEVLVRTPAPVGTDNPEGTAPPVVDLPGPTTSPAPTP